MDVQGTGSGSDRSVNFERLRTTLVVREATRRSMQSNTAVGTKPEETLRKELWRAGHRGFRKNVRKLPGSPDILFPKYRLAVFVHGCYWHGCPECIGGRIPKTNREYWRAKIARNIERDEQSIALLNELGYRTLTIWECQIRADVNESVRLISLELSSKVLPS
jgi:DNA mismatch endonuclease (patch repair protein)